MPDQYTNCRSLYFLSRNRLFRTTYEQVSRDDFFKIPKPRINSPLSLFLAKPRFFSISLNIRLKILLPGGIAPAHATEALNKNIRLDLKINPSNSKICDADEYNV